MVVEEVVEEVVGQRGGWRGPADHRLRCLRFTGMLSSSVFLVVDTCGISSRQQNMAADAHERVQVLHSE